MIRSVSVDVGYIDVDVDLDEFETDDLIDELESRGYFVESSIKDIDNLADAFEPEQLDVLIKLIDSQNVIPGSILYSIRERLVR